VTDVLHFTAKNRPSGQVLNIGTHDETGILDLVEAIKKLARSSSATRFLPSPPGDHKRRLPDTDDAPRKLNDPQNHASKTD